jgi:hypothetical protein
MHLTDYGIHPLETSKTPDLKDINVALARRRSSLSSSQFSDDDFQAFRIRNYRAKDEDDILANVIPIILGSNDVDRLCGRNTVFIKLKALTDGTITAPKPDYYFGADPKELARCVRDKLKDHIMPSATEDKPMLPNFFIEVKGPDGQSSVLTRQARYHGAVGSRAMLSLQNYGMKELQYDNQVYTFSSTYYDGTLKLFAHHVTAPTTSGGRPEYHMTEIRTFGLTDTRKTCVQGMRALRNALDLAEEYRNGFMRAANIKASELETSDSEASTADEIQLLEETAGELAPSTYGSTQILYEEASPDELASSSRHVTQIRTGELSLDGAAPSTRCITQIQREDSSPDELAASFPNYRHGGGDLQNPLSFDSPTALATSFTSSLGPYERQLKRRCSPCSDDSRNSAPSTRLNKKKKARSITSTRPLLPDTREPSQVPLNRKGAERLPQSARPEDYEKS